MLGDFFLQLWERAGDLGILVLAVFILKVWIDRVVNHKYDELLAKTKNELAKDAKRDEVRFGSQYQKVAEAIVGVHARLDDLSLAVGRYIDPTGDWKAGVAVEKGELKEDLEKAGEELWSFFRRHRIYLPASTASLVTERQRDLTELAFEFYQKVDSAQIEGDYGGLAEWARLYGRMQSQIKPLLRELEEEFQELLGIPEMARAAGRGATREPLSRDNASPGAS